MTDYSKKNTHHMIAFATFVILSVGIMCVIFYFSNQNGLMSNDYSNSFSTNLLNFISPIMPESLTNYIINYIRKIAHFVLYFSMGIMLSLSVKEWLYIKKPNQKHIFKYYALTFAITFIYAISDEIHQYFIPGRSGKFPDVLLDSCGSALGIIIIWLITKLFSKTY